MSDTIIVAVLSLVGTLAGTFGGILTSNRLTGYRIEQLEKKVEEHNGVCDRVTVLEDNMKFFDKMLAKFAERLDRWEEKHNA